MTWRRLPLKRVASIRVSNVDKKTVEGEPQVRLCNYTDVYYRNSIDPSQNFMRATASPEQVSAFRLEPGDVVITKDSESADDIGIPTYVERGAPDLVCGYHLALIRPRQDAVSGRFLYWAMTSSSTRSQLEVAATGITRFGLRADAIGSAVMEVPSLSVQRAVVGFLDAETTRIDALIAKKRRTIELLEERLWNWLSDRIRQTGAPTVPLRRALAWINDGPFGSSLTSAHYSDDGARVVRLGNIGMAEFKNKDEAYISTEHYAALLKHRVRAGDLLVAGLGDAKNHVGRGCVAPDLGPAIVKADCYCAAVEERVASADFLALYLASPLGRNAVAYLSRGSTRTRINLDVAKAIPVVLPALSDQDVLVAEARDRRQTNGSLQETLRRQVRLLQEHRQALVTAAVTGQMEVPGVAA